MDEMRQLIGKRYGGDVTPRTPQRNLLDTPKRGAATGGDDFTRSIEDYIFDADGNLANAVATQDTLQADVKMLATSLKEVRVMSVHQRCQLIPHTESN